MKIKAKTKVIIPISQNKYSYLEKGEVVDIDESIVKQIDNRFIEIIEDEKENIIPEVKPLTQAQILENKNSNFLINSIFNIKGDKNNASE